ncbi:MAG: DUF3467 domain-containing protein [Solirubrobacteraceae bacterium]
MPDVEEPENEPKIEIILDQSQMAGVWANFASVTHSEHEFTLDFVRLDFARQTGIVVARVSVSPLFVTQLIDALNQNWKNYAAKAMPREVNQNDPEEPDE